MKVILFVNNWVGWKIAEYLATDEKTSIVGLVMHEQKKSKFAEQIRKVTTGAKPAIFEGSALKDEKTLHALGVLGADMGISAFFGYILQQKVLSIFPKECINVHPSFLPYNRGAYPNVFSIIDKTPAGATIHYMDTGIDTGDIINQTKIHIDDIDTSETLYRKLEHECVHLFQETWPSIIAGTAKRLPQKKLGVGTQHKSIDVAQYDEIDRKKLYSADELLNIIRARTFNSYPGAYVRDKDGEKVYLRLQLSRMNDESIQQS